MKLSVAAAAAFAAGMVFAAPAPAPPAYGIPDVHVSARCAPYESSVSVRGWGFEPGAEVLVSAPFGHYTGPPLPERIIEPVTVTAGRDGDIRASLHTPARQTRYWRYQARTIFAEGPAMLNGEQAYSFDQLVIGTKRICNRLERSS